MLREAVITFEVLSFCRNQDRDHVCGEKGVGAVCGGSMCGLRRSRRRMKRDAKRHCARQGCYPERLRSGAISYLEDLF